MFYVLSIIFICFYCIIIYCFYKNIIKHNNKCNTKKYKHYYVAVTCFLCAVIILYVSIVVHVFIYVRCGDYKVLGVLRSVANHRFVWLGCGSAVRVPVVRLFGLCEQSVKTWPRCGGWRAEKRMWASHAWLRLPSG